MANIILIESDRLLAGNLIKYFKGQGHDIVWQVDPQTAMNQADNNCPDLIILDMVLAGRTGAEFLYEFRSYSDWQKIPVVIFSNLPYEELSSPLDSMEHLHIAAYHHKASTSFERLAQSIEQLLQSALV